MPDIWLDVDVAIAECPVNIFPLTDATDMKTIEAAVVFNQAGLVLLWHFVTTAGAMTETAVTPTSGGLHDWSDQGVSGLYAIEIPIASGNINNTEEGFGWFTGVATGVLPWRGPVIGFRLASINDALIDSNTLITSLDIGLLHESTIGTVTSQTEFICDVAIVSDDAWNGLTCTITDISTGETVSRRVTDVIGSTETIHINSAPPFTVVANDVIRVFKDEQSSGALTSYDPPTRTEASADKDAILAKLPSALSSAGNIKSDVKEVVDVTLKESGTGGQKMGAV